VLTQAGTSYALAFSGTDLLGVTSTSFSVVAAAASQLAFVQQPVNAPVNQTLNPPVTVQVLDTFGNAVLSDSSTVTLALGGSPGGVSLTGTTTVQAVNGLATFVVAVNQVGLYTLVASTGSLKPAASAPFSINGIFAGFTIATVAGTGVFGFTGDGGPATATVCIAPTA
jgi:hypothetical protein